MKRAKRLLLTCVLALTACSEPAPVFLDGADDSFGGSLLKADGTYEECVVLEVLELVNEATSDVPFFQSLGLRSDAGENIVAHRHGPDGMPGTGDDDIFDDLQELDDIRFVGPASMEALTNAVAARCEDDLDSRPYMDATTFAGSTGGGWSRDNTELEATFAIDGITGQQLRDILVSTDSRDRTIFSRLRRGKLMEAFTASYAIDEMPWDSDSHNAREALPYVPLTIERGRYEPDDDGARELNLGTDINDDIYYDTDEYVLLGEEIVVRGRVRHDSATEIRRLLIAAKFGTVIGEDGIKRTGKVDVRTDSPDRFVGTFDEDVRRGRVNWAGSDTPVEPLRAVYEYLDERGLLPDISGRENVLLLEPMVHLRSTRSRYHLDVASQSSVQGLIRNGDTRIQAAIDLAQTAIAEDRISAADLAEVNDFIALAERTLSGEEIAARLGAAPAALPVNFSTRASDGAELEANKTITEAVDVLYHDVAEALDDIDRAITGTSGLDYDEYADMFEDFARANNTSLRLKRTIQPFLAFYQQLDMADGRVTFSDYAEAQFMDGNEDFEDWQGLDDEKWGALGAHLEYEMLKISKRQIEYAGTAGNMMWFDQAREHYVPASSRPSGNFLIDTFDMTEMVTHEMWSTITEDERRIDQPLDPAKIFHTVLVNEVQIELGQETAFVERVSALTEIIDGGMGTPEDEANLEGAQFVLAQYVMLMQSLAELKGEPIMDRLEDEGAPNTISWSPAEYGKGETALRRLADLD